MAALSDEAIAAGSDAPLTEPARPAISAKPDPFRTATLRRAVLDAWAASPARFREDANAEEALAIGGYADRVLIELAANAVDAAREAGVPGRVRFILTADSGKAQLRAANVGAPLTPAGVSGLASLRASAKRGHGQTVGHFGVGFTAVLAVTDAPEVISRTGAVRFSRADTAAAVSALRVPELLTEMDARSGEVPALRLPWPARDAASKDPIPAGFDTEVRLPLREGSEQAVRDKLRSIDDDLLWALPGLETVEIDLGDGQVRILRREDRTDGITLIHDGVATRRFRSVTRSGRLPPALLDDRPVEERGRDSWQLTWVLPEPEPLTAAGFSVDSPPPPVFLGAPTPTDEPICLPARLIGTFPVDDTRRRLAPGRLTDHLLSEAAADYVDLFVSVSPQRRLALVPSAGFPLGPVDATLRELIVGRLSREPVLVTALDDAVAPAQASVIPKISDAAAKLLARAVPGLLLPPRSVADWEALRLLGVVTVPLSDATTALAGIDGPPTFWHQIYSSLADQPSEDLANLPVPLAGGGRRIGPVGCLLPGPDSADAELLAQAARVAPDLRMIHPVAAHPLLGRLGAVPADADALLADPALAQVFREFRDDLEETDPDPGELAELAGLALALATESTVAGGIFQDVVLTDVGGEAWPAGELLAPGAPLAEILAPDADLPVMGGEWERFPGQALRRVGVRTGLKIVQVEDADADLPDLQQWWSDVVGEGLPPETFDAIADLDLVDDERWPEALAMIEADREAMATLHSGPDPSYTRWWLARSVRLNGRPPTWWRLPEAHELAGLYDELPRMVRASDGSEVTLTPALTTTIGVLSQGSDAVAADPGGLLGRWADPDRVVPTSFVPRATLLAVEALSRNPSLPLPSAVRTLSGAVVDADDAFVLDLPWFAQIIDSGRLVAGGPDPVTTARRLDLELVSDRVRVVVTGGPVGAPTPDQLRAAQWAAESLGLPLSRVFSTGSLGVVTDLTVAVAGAGEVRVSWWPGAELSASAVQDQVAVQGQVTATMVTDGTAEGIGRAMAWTAGRWRERETAVAAARGSSVTFAENGLQ